MTTYPDGYGSRMVTMGQLIATHSPYMHPEFARRLFPWIESMNGQIGIGGGMRITQPVGPTFAPEGQSFHQKQRFASGLFVYSAVDIVAPDGPDGNNSHDGVSWGHSSTAPIYGLHTFIRGEPWHVQCIEIRGYTTWFNNGRLDPGYFKLPIDTPIPPPIPPGGFVHQIVKLGDINADVYALQSVLRNKASQQCPVNGTFDAATHQALVTFQRFMGLMADGICGPKTWAMVDLVANS